jgi:hypothetical protein
VVSAVVLSLWGVGIGEAVADPATPAPPTPAATATTLITTPADGAFEGRNSFAVSGTKDADGTVVVTATDAAGKTTTVCAATNPTADELGWSCTATAVPNGKKVSLVATQTLAADSSTTSTSITLSVLGAPSLDGAGSFVTPGIVSGGAITGNFVTVTVSNPSAAGCTSGVVNGYWSCSIKAPSGTYTVTAHQSWTSGSTQHSEESAPQHVTVDKDRPAQPVVTSPKADSRVTRQPVTFSGTGETLGFLNVYVDASPVCGASVDGSGHWSCSASGISNGTHAVQAIQSDLAGNFSDPSPPVKVYFGPKAAAPPVVPPKNTTPNSPSPESPSPTPTPAPGSSAPPVPYVPGSGAPPPTLHEALTNWGTPTSFGTRLPTLADTLAGGGWWLALPFALSLLLLVALPLRLLASSLRGRVRLPMTKLTGRNQQPGPDEELAPPNPWLLGAVPLAAAAGFVVLASGVNGEVRFVRLLAAVGIGLALLNVVGVAVSTRLSGRLQGVTGRLRFLPSLLLAATLLAMFSRLSGVNPPLVAGVLIGVGFAGVSAARPRGIANLVEVGSITVLATTAWFVYQWLRPLEGFWGNLTLEILATVCLAGLGSALVLLIPLGRLPGRVIFEWSALAWAGILLVVAVLAWVIALDGNLTNLPTLGAFAMVAGGFTALCVAVWAWVRYVEPAEA